MSEVRIYKLNLSAGDFALGTGGGPSWRSSSFGGSDTPIAGYPEFGEMENVRRNEGVGSSGQNVIDADNTSQYIYGWITLCGVGPLANGQFDCRGGGAGRPLKARWKQQLRASAFAETSYSQPIALCNGGTGGSGSGLFGSNRFVIVEMYPPAAGSPPNFVYNLRARVADGMGSFAFAETESATKTADDAEHEMVLTLVPGTVTGAFAGDGFAGSGTIAADGSVDFAVDGVSVASLSGIALAINPFATSNPDVYYGKTIWHGD